MWLKYEFTCAAYRQTKESIIKINSRTMLLIVISPPLSLSKCIYLSLILPNTWYGLSSSHSVQSKLRLKRILWYLNCYGLTVKLSGRFRSMAKSNGLVVSLVDQKSCTYSSFAECICKSDVVLEAQCFNYVSVSGIWKQAQSSKNAILKHIRITAVAT